MDPRSSDRKYIAGLRAWFYRIKHGEDHHRFGVERLVHGVNVPTSLYGLADMSHREVYSTSVNFPCGMLPCKNLLD